MSIVFNGSASLVHWGIYSTYSDNVSVTLTYHDLYKNLIILWLDN